jgi:hypothetical protein
MIRKYKSKYILYSKTIHNGKHKRLGEFPSLKQAKKREKQINYFKYLQGKK